MPAPVVKAESVSKRFGDFDAVKGLSFEVREGECFGLLGPNGAGKSTLMGMLYGVNLRNSGGLSVFGLDPAVNARGIKKRLVADALKLFYEIRDVPGLKKKPSTSELLDWLKLLMSEDVDENILRERDPRKVIPPLHGALLKNEQDVHLFERLAFIARREGA